MHVLKFLCQSHSLCYHASWSQVFQPIQLSFIQAKMVNQCEGHAGHIPTPDTFFYH